MDLARSGLLYRVSRSGWRLFRRGLAGRLAGKANIVLGARDPRAGQLSYADAVAKADIVVLAVPFDAALVM